MPIRDILLQMNSYPNPTPLWAIEAAVNLADRLDARMSAGMCRVNIPDVSNYLSQLLVRSQDVIAEENRKSAKNAAQLMLDFDKVVGQGRCGEPLFIECQTLVTPWKLAAKARLRDLTIVPMYGHPETRSVIEGLVFESGRPVLILPPEGEVKHQFKHMVIGWDGGRAAARALASCLDFCKAAHSVTIVTITGEKDLPEIEPASEVVRHLSLHGIAAEAVEVRLTEEDAGTALRNYCMEKGTHLLVMGAYGHTRVREFVLGGATRAILEHSGLPVLLAH